MNFNVDTSVPLGVKPIGTGKFIGLVYSNVLESSLNYYLPLTGGTLSSNLGIGSTISSLSTGYTLNVNSYIVASSNITACSNIITSNINSININNSTLINTGPLTFTNTLTQQNTNLITLRGILSIASNISLNAFNVQGEPPVANTTLMGGNGSRIILRNAKSQIQFPDAIGLNTDTLWLSSSNIFLYVNGVNQFNINSNGILTTSNQINQINSGVNNFFMGKVGIATSLQSDYNLNVNGSFNSTSINTATLTVNGLDISSGIASSSSESSNYVRTASNILRDLINITIDSTSNYVRTASNILLAGIVSSNTITSNYATAASNILLAGIVSSNTITSNYATAASNILLAGIVSSNTITSNYVRAASNILLDGINSSNSITSNYATAASNILLAGIVSSNSITSNYATLASNILLAGIVSSNSITSNYVRAASNILLDGINSSNSITSNYVRAASNILLDGIVSSNSITSNYVRAASNILLDGINSSNSITSNYVRAASNILLAGIVSSNTITSNYATAASNILLAGIVSSNTITSNYATAASNILLAGIVSSNSITSNYVRDASNVLISGINSSNSITSNYVRDASNVLISGINSSNSITSNYVRDTSNVLLTGINLTSNYVRAASNVLLTGINSTSNYVREASNILLTGINSTSNYVREASNVLLTGINSTSNYVRAASNVLLDGINSSNSITSNYVRAASNMLQANINATNNNISTNYYIRGDIDTLLGAKQATLTSTTTLSGTGGSITGINYITVINKPAYSSPLSSNATTNTVSIDLSSYALNGSLTTAQTYNSNYTKEASNALKTFIDAKEQILTFSSPLGRSTNAISIDLSSTSNYTRNASNTLKALIDGNDALYLKLGGGGTISSGSINFSGNPRDNVINLISTTYGFGTEASALKYNADTNASHKFYASTNLLCTITSNKIIINQVSSGTTAGIPAVGTAGGLGDKIILFTGTPTTYPHSIGISSGTSPLTTMWFSGPTGVQYDWYTGSTYIMNLTSGGILSVKDDVIAFVNLSDKRLKTNIKDLSINCTNLIKKIRSVEFNWIDHNRIPERKRHTKDHGFIAQDIEELLPNLVNNEGEYKSLKYEKLTPYLVKAFQELYAIIENQQNQINELKSHLNL